MEEVGQQSADSVSDRSCHHAALTGCTLRLGNLKSKHAHTHIYSLNLQAAAVKSHKPAGQGEELPGERVEITRNTVNGPIM